MSIIIACVLLVIAVLQLFGKPIKIEITHKVPEAKLVKVEEHNDKEDNQDQEEKLAGESFYVQNYMVVIWIM